MQSFGKVLAATLLIRALLQIKQKTKFLEGVDVLGTYEFAYGFVYHVPITVVVPEYEDKIWNEAQ